MVKVLIDTYEPVVLVVSGWCPSTTWLASKKRILPSLRTIIRSKVLLKYY
jgi:hypothetical protein